ncbi:MULTISPECIES: hypothetical protein [Streptomyces]|uniref:hypothetical protein n=1 Tax=Streptomyces TaxID=1883 RepID=UPI00345C5DA7
MPAPSTSTPVETPELAYGAVLAEALPPREYQALMDSTFLNSQRRTAITLVAVGHTLNSAAQTMGVKPTTLTSYLASAANELRCHQRVSLLVHCAYSHPDFPAPTRLGGPAPKLDADEWMVLSAHADGIFFKQLSKAKGFDVNVLTAINHSLLAKLQADSPAHAVRRAWQYGLLPRDDAPAGPSAKAQAR